MLINKITCAFARSFKEDTDKERKGIRLEKEHDQCKNRGNNLVVLKYVNVGDRRITQNKNESSGEERE